MVVLRINVGKTRAQTIPVITIFIGGVHMCTPFPVMGGLWHCFTNTNSLLKKNCWDRNSIYNLSCTPQKWIHIRSVWMGILIYIYIYIYDIYIYMIYIYIYIYIYTYIYMIYIYIYTYIYDIYIYIYDIYIYMICDMWYMIYDLWVGEFNRCYISGRY